MKKSESQLIDLYLSGIGLSVTKTADLSSILKIGFNE